MGKRLALINSGTVCSFFLAKYMKRSARFVVLRFCVDMIYRPDPKQIIHKLYREQLTTGEYLKVCVEIHSVLILQLDPQFY